MAALVRDFLQLSALGFPAIGGQSLMTMKTPFILAFARQPPMSSSSQLRQDFRPSV